MSYEKSTLKKIENLRYQLVKCAYTKGFTNSETVQVSQQLDVLLNSYSNIKQQSR